MEKIELNKIDSIENRCLGCGIKLEAGEVCYHCLFDGLTITYIHNKTGKTRVIGADGKLYVIWFD